MIAAYSIAQCDWMVGQVWDLAEIGRHHSRDKMAASFAKA
jgi:hypothetical protein